MSSGYMSTKHGITLFQHRSWERCLSSLLMTPAAQCWVLRPPSLSRSTQRWNHHKHTVETSKDISPAVLHSLALCQCLLDSFQRDRTRGAFITLRKVTCSLLFASSQSDNWLIWFGNLHSRHLLHLSLKYVMSHVCIVNMYCSYFCICGSGQTLKIYHEVSTKIFKLRCPSVVYVIEPNYWRQDMDFWPCTSGKLWRKNFWRTWKPQRPRVEEWGRCKMTNRTSELRLTTRLGGFTQLTILASR